MTYTLKREFNRIRLLPKVHLLCIFLAAVTLCSTTNGSEDKLYKALFGNKTFNKKLLPVENRTQPLLVHFGFTLINIVNVNARAQFISVYGWVAQKWNNSNLMWDPDDYGGLRTMHVGSNEVWVPDVLLYHNLDEQDHIGGGRHTYKTRVILNSDGTNHWNSPALFKIFCQIQVKYFPLDDQECTLKFGSWTHSIRTIDLQPMQMKFPTVDYTKNGEWRIYSMTFLRNQRTYPCCEHPFADVSLTVKMTREASDYLINLIIPCCLISSMIFLGFVLPPESGERIGLSITVLLAMTVFQQLTSEIMPAYDFPILGQYYFAIVLEISASLVATTLILNFYHRTNRKMPPFLRKLILCWLSRLVLLHDEVLSKYPNAETNSLEASRKNENKYNRGRQSTRSKSARATMRKQKDVSNNIGISSVSSDRYADNVYGNDQTSDKDDIELHGLPNTYTAYPFLNMVSREKDDREKERKHLDDRQDISDDESALRQWEWTLAARILDRFVLVVAVVIGVVTVIAVFLRAPSLWQHRIELTKDNPANITHVD